LDLRGKKKLEVVESFIICTLRQIWVSLFKEEQMVRHVVSMEEIRNEYNGIYSEDLGLDARITL
jgi:hypothetical protein